jgi:hypothetical protein
MTHIQLELARDRHRGMLAAAAAQRDGLQALKHGRISRKAERAERLQVSRADQVARLRAVLEQIEAGC